MEQVIFNTREAASYLRMSPWTLRTLVKGGDISFVSVGDKTSKLRFTKQHLDSFVQRHTVVARADEVQFCTPPKNS